VTFDIDANGIVHVSAKDMGTGKEQKIRIEASSGLSEAEIEKMVKEAEAHAEEDKKERERAEIRNEADTFLYSTEKSLKDYGDKVGEAERASIQAAMDDLKKAIESNDLEQMKAKMETLKQASYKLAEEVYKAAGAQNQGAQPNEGQGAQAEPETKTADDVDYKVVDDEDKK
jgi:molecular chaperone DnaK